MFVPKPDDCSSASISGPHGAGSRLLSWSAASAPSSHSDPQYRPQVSVCVATGPADGPRLGVGVPPLSPPSTDPTRGVSRLTLTRHRVSATGGVSPSAGDRRMIDGSDREQRPNVSAAVSCRVVVSCRGSSPDGRSDLSPRAGVSNRQLPRSIHHIN